MRFHIIRTTDTLDRIANIYNLSIMEIKTNNTHISDWKHLIPGTKIRLPSIPEYLSDELDNTEPFIEDYYPKLNAKAKINIEKEIMEEKKLETEELEEKKEETTSPLNEPINTPNFSYYYPPYYYFPNQPVKKIRGRG